MQNIRYMEQIKCKVRKYKRDEKTEWIVFETKDFAILQIRDEDLLYFPDKIRKVELIKNDNYYDCVRYDKHNYRTTYERIDRELMQYSDLWEFLQQHLEYYLIKKFRNYFELKKLMP